MSVLNKESILKANDAPCELVKVPEWGGEVYVKTLTAAEREAYEDAVYVFEGGTPRFVGENPWSELLVRTLCNEQGVRIFTDEDAKALAGRAGPVLQRLYRIAARLNRIGTAGDDVKNSDDAQGGSSSSSSASPSASSTPTT